MGKLMYKGVPYSATGEVEANPQGTPSDVLDSIKINGTVYGIEGGAGIFIGNVPTNYSTEEKVIGTWTDGKPLYQKTIIKDNPTISNEFANIGSITNLETLVNSFGSFQRNDVKGLMYSFNGSTRPEVINTSPFISVRYYNGNIQCAISTTTFTDVTKIFITIQYTKTTDTAYTVPVGYSDYYSTDEQIVGRWIDGKPLYQKTVQNNSGITNLNAWEEIADVGGTCDIKKVEGYIITSIGDIPFNYSGDGANISYIMNTNASIVKTLGKVTALLSSGSNWLRNLPIIVTLQYTKTTN